jgi:arginase
VAVKIVRQPGKIVLLGAPTSAAALTPGHEAGPAALRSAGLIGRLKAIGYEVVDLGDDPVQISQHDEENPRTRNLPAVVKSLETFKPKVEQAVKSGAFPLILGGDCSIALATIAGAHRYIRNVGLIYMDHDADLNTPATTLSGSLDGMVLSHLIGYGAPELVRLWGKPPLVREPDLVLFGVDRLDAAEEQWLKRSTLTRFLASDIRRLGAAKAAQLAVEHVHASQSAFVLHFDVDTISNFEFTDYPGPGGLSIEEMRDALAIFLKQERLAAVEVTGYTPKNDSDGAGARLIIDLLAEALQGRLAPAPDGDANGPSIENSLSAQPAEATPHASPQTSGDGLSTDLPASLPTSGTMKDELTKDESIP